MHSTRIEFDRQSDLDQFISTASSLEGLVFQGLDFTAYPDTWLDLPATDALFLGCTLPAGATYRLGHAGATVLAAAPGLPFDPFPRELYRPDDLYKGFDPGDPASYDATPDQRIYLHWWTQGGSDAPSIREALFRRLHDFAMTDALEERLDQPPGKGRVAAIMGGHSLSRADADYVKVAMLARELQRAEFLIITGGGPGAMEAGNLGAACGPLANDALDRALAILREHPKGYFNADNPRDTSGKHAWLAAAWRARDALRSSGKPLGESIGVPTWHYGHEPPNCFATWCSKYFANSEREDGLLTIARAGIVFAPGAAGTIQEIFQDAAQNYYARDKHDTPMVFLNKLYWEWQRPAFALLAQLALGKPFSQWLLTSDSVGEIASFLIAYQRR